MKKAMFIILFLANGFICISQPLIKKQIVIPLNNKLGVPFYKDDITHELVVDGFDIDAKGNFYFLGGDKSTCLAVFLGNKPIYRRTFKWFPTGPIYIYGNDLYTFDNSRTVNNLFVINPTSGTLINKISHISGKHFNSIKFVDSCLILERLGYPNFTYEQFALNGKYLKKADGRYNIDSLIIPEKGTNSKSCLFIGKWQNAYVFSDLTGKNMETQTFWLVDNDGKVRNKRILPNDNKLFGDDFYEAFPTEHLKVRNGNLYVLGRKGNNAVITIVPLDSFFGK
jgi:hypothetical protein